MHFEFRGIFKCDDHGVVAGHEVISRSRRVGNPIRLSLLSSVREERNRDG